MGKLRVVLYCLFIVAILSLYAATQVEFPSGSPSTTKEHIRFVKSKHGPLIAYNDLMDEIRQKGHLYSEMELVPTGMDLALGPNQAFVDVGAHYGRFTYVAALKGHKAVAYEPRPAFQDLIRATINANPEFQGRIRFHGAGAWHEDTTLYLEYTTETNVANAFDATVKADNKGRDGKTVIPMKVVTLDATVPPDWDVGYIKIDAQGADCNVLEGAYNLIRRPSVKLITIEFAPFLIRSRGGRDPLRLLQLFDDAGYMVFECERHRSRKKLPRSDEILRQVWGGNYTERIQPENFAAFVKEYDDESEENMKQTPRVLGVYGELIALRKRRGA